MARYTELEQYLNNPRVKIFLETLADAEGTLGGANPYLVYGGNVKNQAGGFTTDNFFAPWKFKDHSGNSGTATASGKYQFTKPTWNDLAKNWGFTDLSPHQQDLAAIALMKQNGSLQHVINGDWIPAFNKAASTWASLSPDNYNQATRTGKEHEAFMNYYAKKIGYNDPISLAGLANYDAVHGRASKNRNYDGYYSGGQQQMTQMQQPQQLQPTTPKYLTQPLNYDITKLVPSINAWNDLSKQSLDQYNSNRYNKNNFSQF